MNQKYDGIRLVLYLLVFLAALIYPVSKILTFEWHRGEAAVFDFRVAVYDPYDPFRGSYVNLQFDDSRQTHYIAPEKAGTDSFLQNPAVFAVLEKNSDGFAAIGSVVPDIESVPAGKSYLRICPSNGYVRLPFQKFFLNEKLAPDTEKVLWDAKTKYLRVLVYPNGTYAVEDLYVDGIPIREYLEGRRAK